MPHFAVWNTQFLELEVDVEGLVSEGTVAELGEEGVDNDIHLLHGQHRGQLQG